MLCTRISQMTSVYISNSSMWMIYLYEVITQ